MSVAVETCILGSAAPRLFPLVTVATVNNKLADPAWEATVHV